MRRSRSVVVVARPTGTERGSPPRCAVTTVHTGHAVGPPSRDLPILSVVVGQRSEAGERGAASAADADDVEIDITGSPQRDLAPMIHRQRLVIEGTRREPITDRQISEFLSRLSAVCDMKQLMEPVTHRSDAYGWAGWVHWETSGAHFYAWETPMVFFSVDVYTCKPFDVDAAIGFTREFFDADELVAKGF
jgi:hypothetical protein